MKLNADFDCPAAVFDAENAWVPSPMAGVERKMLDRIGDEVARATTVVRFAPGSSFSPHMHGGGEEFFVLEGVFQDEHGDYPTGYYVRNPPSSSHTPATSTGCTILVKLHQFAPEDRSFVLIDTTKSYFVDVAGRTGIAEMPLFDDKRERVRIEKWLPNGEIDLDADGGLEAFVIDGGFNHDGKAFGKWDWLRLPPGGSVPVRAAGSGAKVWIKSGHLSQIATAT